MQQYRVNYVLLIGLVVGTLLTSGAVYGLWRFQIERNSDILKADAEKAFDKEDYRDAAMFYAQYLAIHPDDDATRVKYANTHINITELDNVKPEEVGLALRTVEGTVRRLPDEDDLRKRTAQLYARFGQITPALDHVGYLLETDPDNAELKTLRMQYQTRAGNYDAAVKDGYALIGYDDDEEAFDSDKAGAPNDPKVYAMLASVLRSKQSEPELADRVMDQMIEVNPESATAYLLRGQYRMGIEQKDAGKADVEKAYELDPKSADVLLMMGSLAAEDEQFEKAHEYLQTGKQLYPQDIRFYTSLASVEFQEDDFDGAMAQVEEGMKTIEGGAQALLIHKADLQFRQNDLEGVRDTIDRMRQAQFRPEYIDWLNARIKLVEGKWFEAAEDLKRLRVRVGDMFDLAIQADMFLGLAYEKLGRWELARDAYASVLKQDEENEPAAAGYQRMLEMIGLVEPDRPSEQDDDAQVAQANDLQQIINAELQKPVAEQNWKPIEEGIKKIAEERGLEEYRVKLMLANIALARKDFAGARKLLEEANRLSPDNLAVYRMVVEALRADPKFGPAPALKRLDAVVKKFGDLPSLRLQRAQLLLQSSLEAEELKSQLTALAAGTDEWTDAQKVELWNGLAGIYISLNMPEEARRYLTLAADHQPNDLPTRLTLFALALEANDDEAMKAAQDKILEIVRNKNDSTWLYTEARRKLWQVRRGQLDKDDLEDIRILISRALSQRPDWNELYLLRAELELADGNAELALKNYEEAAARGRGTPAANAQHIRLVALRGDFHRAKELLDRIPEGLRQPLLGPLYAEILFRTNEVDNAITQAQAAAKAAPNNPQNHYWLGELLARSAQMPNKTDAERKTAINEAIEAFKTTLQLRPDFADGWYALVRLHAMNKDVTEAQAALRQAQLVLSTDTLPLFLARSYEALGRWFDAETMYRTVYETDPSDVSRAQLLAAFYLGPVYQLPDRQAKVRPLINQILRAGAEKTIEPDSSVLLWARRMGAKLLAANRDYQQLLKAEDLLSSNAEGGVLSIEDKLEMAQILASRPDPVSRLKAARLLEEVAEVQSLNLPAELSLGQMYYLLNRWSDAQRQMRSVTNTKFPNSAEARAAYIRMLLARGEKSNLDEATRQLDRLRQLAPNTPVTFELTVRLATKTGRERQAREELLRILPLVTKAEEFTPQHIDMIKVLANLFIELDDKDNAEKILRLLAEKDPRQQHSLALFLGLRRDVQQAIDLLEKLYQPDAAVDTLQAANNVLRARRDDIGDKFDPHVELWFERALRENPGSIPLLIAKADLLDIQQRYEDAIELYKGLLSRDELTGFRRAVVLNNLSYLLALAGASDGNIDPLELVEEAESILGPTADILDTRAVVLIAAGKYSQAAEDLELAVTDTPTASKYFHKVQAHLGARENKDALEAWERAEQLGLSRESLNRLEHERYDEVKKQIDALQSGTGTVTQAEPRRRAG